ncbi:MAG: YraN family protein [Pseudomonadota bacterium]
MQKPPTESSRKSRSDRCTERKKNLGWSRSESSGREKVASVRGAEFERRSALFLQQQGFRIISQNYRCKVGEIDLIAADEHRLLFVEVRARRTKSHGSAASTVARQKQCKIKKCAAFFLQKHPRWANVPCRFDVITWEPFAAVGLGAGSEVASANAASSGGCYSAHWIPGAFLA